MGLPNCFRELAVDEGPGGTRRFPAVPESMVDIVIELEVILLDLRPENIELRRDVADGRGKIVHAAPDAAVVRVEPRLAAILVRFHSRDSTACVVCNLQSVMHILQ